MSNDLRGKVRCFDKRWWHRYRRAVYWVLIIDWTFDISVRLQASSDSTRSKCARSCCEKKLKESTCRYIALNPHLSSHKSVTLVWPTTWHEQFFGLTLLNSTPKEYVASLRTSSAANLGNAIQSLGRLDLVIKLLAPEPPAKGCC